MKTAGTVIIIGGGWAGVAAALAARQGGAAKTILLERSNMLLGCGLAGGIMRNNGRYAAAEEMAAMGAGALFSITDAVSTHRGVDFPGHKHAWLYSTTRIEPAVRSFLEKAGVELRFHSRVTDIEQERGQIRAVACHGGVRVDGDVFVESTGSAGSTGNCLRYGSGCAMCTLRCPAFGPRVSLTERLGLEDVIGMRKDGTPGTFSGAFEVRKSSLSPDLADKLTGEGVAVIPIPAELTHAEVLSKKSCQQYALHEFAVNLILLDMGDAAKVMTPFFPLAHMRRLPGLESVVSSMCTENGNSVRFLSRAPRDGALRVEGFSNFFCAGEKSGFFVGHTEAIVTGSLAGHNAARVLEGKNPISLPAGLACGDIIAAEQEGLALEDGLTRRYTFSGGAYFTRMREKDLYSTDVESIRRRVHTAGAAGLFGGMGS